MTTVRFTVKKGRAEHGTWQVELDGAHVGEVEPASQPDDAEVTFTVDPGDVDALASGALSFSVGFMRGQVKMAGDPGALLDVLAVLDSEAFAGARSTLFA